MVGLGWVEHHAVPEGNMCQLVFLSQLKPGFHPETNQYLVESTNDSFPSYSSEN